MHMVGGRKNREYLMEQKSYPIPTPTHKGYRMRCAGALG